MADTLSVTVEQFIVDFQEDLFTRRGTLYKIFEGEFVRSVFSQLHKSYISRSRKRGYKGFPEWRDIKESTKARKRKRYPTTANLVNIRTKRAVNSFKPGAAVRSGYKPFNSDQLFEISGSKNEITVTVGSNVLYISGFEKYSEGDDRKVFASGMMEYIVKQAVKVAKRKVMSEIRRRYNR